MTRPWLSGAITVIDGRGGVRLSSQFVDERFDVLALSPRARIVVLGYIWPVLHDTALPT